MKYWNKSRVKKTREREERRKRQALERFEAEVRHRRTYTRGDLQKNAELMLDVLGEERHRRMLAWLRSNGAMSVSKFAKPFHLSLPAAMRYVHLFEQTGFISTHKRGRIRVCVYERHAAEELAAYLRAPHVFERN
jgi:hypothetical protein